MRRAAFLDRDGTIIFDEGYLADASRVRLVPGAARSLRRLREKGALLIVVSNQSGVARGLIRRDQLEAVDAAMDRLLADEGVHLDATYYCEHGPDDGCACRKPRPGMLERAAAEHGIALGRSVMVGDKRSDVEAGRAAGCATALLLSPSAARGSAGGPPVPDWQGDWSEILPSLEEHFTC
jgi:D-glycero-D-manno-heptose 1,7-bisphosphate phosphatase